MIEILDLITFFISTYWLLANVKKLGKNSRYLIFALVYVFYIVPIGLDWLYLMADYSFVSYRVGFIWPRHDLLTVFFYDIGLLYIGYVILHGKIKNSSYNHIPIDGNDKNESLCNIMMIAGMVLPAFATLFLLKEPGMLYIMQWRELHLFPDEGSYAAIERFSYLGISCSIFILFGKKGKRFFSFPTLLKLSSIAFVYMNICIQGKRAILFYAIINFMVMLYIHVLRLLQSNKNIRRFITVAIVVVAVGSYAMISVTAMVKRERTDGLIEDTWLYTTTRIDFFRDDRVRMAIGYSVHPEAINIVSYPGQTFIRDFMSFIPFNYVQERIGWNKETYQTRFTHALIGINPNTTKMDIAENSWMTVTVFAEIISNLGFFIGIILIPWFCLWFVKRIDKYPYPYNAFIICCFILMNLFDFVYIAVFVEFTFILCWLYNRKNKRLIIHNESISYRATT